MVACPNFGFKYYFGGQRWDSMSPAVSLFPEASEFFSTEIVRNQTQDEHFDYNKIINQTIRRYLQIFTQTHISENYAY